MDEIGNRGSISQNIHIITLLIQLTILFAMD